MRSAALSLVALLLLSAAPPSESSSVPAAAAAIHEASIDVSIQGPTTAAGGFALVGSGPKDAVLRWRIESPDGAAEPLRLLDASGAPVLVFMSPSAGRYRVLLTGQVATEGLDPFGESTHVVTVGNVPPVPQPPGPNPPGPVPPPTPPPVIEKATAATYVYEKDQHAVPNPILSALNKLNRERGIVATILEADPKDGTGDVPEQYKIPLAAAKKAGLPCLVVTAGDKVLSVLSDPKDEQAVLDAVK